MSSADMVEMTITNGMIRIIGADIVQTRNKLELQAEKETTMDWRELMDMVSKWQEDATKLRMIEEVIREEDNSYSKIRMISRIVGIKNKEK